MAARILTLFDLSPSWPGPRVTTFQPVGGNPIQDLRPKSRVCCRGHKRPEVLQRGTAVGLAIAQHAPRQVRRHRGDAGKDGGGRHHPTRWVDHGEDRAAQPIEADPAIVGLQCTDDQAVFAVELLQYLIEEAPGQCELVEQPALYPDMDSHRQRISETGAQVDPSLQYEDLRHRGHAQQSSQ
jgi:hypothetical protein